MNFVRQAAAAVRGGLPGQKGYFEKKKVKVL